MRLAKELEGVHVLHSQQVEEMHVLEKMSLAQQRTLFELLLHEAEKGALLKNEQFDMAALLWIQVADRTTDRGTLCIIEKEGTLLQAAKAAEMEKAVDTRKEIEKAETARRHAECSRTILATLLSTGREGL